jgi:hypothetical protein
VAKVERFFVRLKNEHNPFGEVSEAWIRLRGPMARLWPTENDIEGGGEFLAPRARTSYSTTLENTKLDDVDVLRSGQWRDWEIYVLVLTKKRRGGNNDPGFGLLVTSLVDAPTIPLISRVGWMYLGAELESATLADEAC